MNVAELRARLADMPTMLGPPSTKRFFRRVFYRLGVHDDANIRITNGTGIIHIHWTSGPALNADLVELMHDWAPAGVLIDLNDGTDSELVR